MMHMVAQGVAGAICGTWYLLLTRFLSRVAPLCEQLTATQVRTEYGVEPLLLRLGDSLSDRW